MATQLPESKTEYDELVVRRVERLLDDMEWTPLDLAKRIYKGMHYADPKAITHFFNRNRHMHPFLAIRIGQALGIDPGYILMFHDDLDGTFDPDGLYALRRQIKRMKGNPPVKARTTA